MELRLRQICLVAQELAPVVDALTDVFGVEVCYRDPGVKRFGLENALMPFGNQLLEVVAPVEEDTTAGRYLERRGGDGGYMVITQCQDAAWRDARVEATGMRLAFGFQADEYDCAQLHPKDTGGTFFEIDYQHGGEAEDGPWHPAGPDWKKFRRLERVAGFAAAEIQSPDPERLARRWAGIIDRATAEASADAWTIALDNAELRFVPARDGRPEGLGGIEVIATDPGACLAAAQARGCRGDGDLVELCGTRFRVRPRSEG